ncbi:hypothetical protein RA27_02075 [Ruegeria sp. ANG-R]|uniref:hypothetical protein n=1 Tax=Ruegeria sp. ANG-R TaxID=1577903 RepID=UPI00057D7B7C|nr:hypothetical protein [Ruegeria sp. ANG-R]KIC42205.1 hypothetical protein RA27_02075 [Ruegeria sp. ANG-R]
MANMYPPEVIAAAKRVSSILTSGCDRCEMDDLDLLHSNALMTIGPVEHASDTLEEGDTAYFFNEAGDRLVAEIQGSDKGNQ